MTAPATTPRVALRLTYWCRSCQRAQRGADSSLTCRRCKGALTAVRRGETFPRSPEAPPAPPPAPPPSPPPAPPLTHRERLALEADAHLELAWLMALWDARGLAHARQRFVLEGGAQRSRDEEYRPERERRAAQVPAPQSTLTWAEYQAQERERLAVQVVGEELAAAMGPLDEPEATPPRPLALWETVEEEP